MKTKHIILCVLSSFALMLSIWWIGGAPIERGHNAAFVFAMGIVLSAALVGSAFIARIK